MPLNRKIRVLFVPQWYPLRDPAQQIGGTFCREHVRASALYDDVAVLVFTSRPQRWPTMHWEREEDQGIPTFYATYGLSPIPKTTLPFFYFHLRRALRRVIEEWGCPDVIHTQDVHAYYVIKAMKSTGIPSVISQHWSGFLERTVDGPTVRRYRWAFQQAVRVLPANKFAARDYQQYGLQAPITWLPNTIDIAVFRPPFLSQRERWLLHASGFTVQKRLPDIIHAFAHVRRRRPDAVLQLVGDGPYRAEMEALAERELPAGSFRFHGVLTKPELAMLMGKASGFVLASDAENLPCVLIEALACGCPVLTTRVGAIPALIPERDGLFVDVGNLEQIVEGMCRLVDGTHGFDMERISLQTREQFSHVAVGRILHGEHQRAVEACQGRQQAEAMMSETLTDGVR